MNITRRRSYRPVTLQECSTLLCELTCNAYTVNISAPYRTNYGVAPPVQYHSRRTPILTLGIVRGIRPDDIRTIIVELYRRPPSPSHSHGTTGAVVGHMQVCADITGMIIRDTGNIGPVALLDDSLPLVTLIVILTCGGLGSLEQAISITRVD